MSNSMEYTNQLLSMCVEAANGRYDEGQQSALASQITGAFASMPVVGRNIVNLAGRRDWNALIGAIGSYADVQGASSKATNISVVNTASAVARASSRTSLSAAFRSIERSDGLTDEQKERLEDLLTEMEQAAMRQDHKGFADRMSRWMALVADSTTVLTACAPFLANLLSIVGGA